MKEREALKLALELAHGGVEIHSPYSPEYKVCAALIALAQPEQRSVSEHLEPVAWLAESKSGRMVRFTKSGEEADELKQYGWTLTPLYTTPQRKPLTDDTRRLDALAENSWDLRCFDMPTGAGDADIGWMVIEHHMAKPHERTVGEVYQDDPRKAIDRAIEAAHGIKE